MTLLLMLFQLQTTTHSHSFDLKLKSTRSLGIALRMHPQFSLLKNRNIAWARFDRTRLTTRKHYLAKEVLEYDKEGQAKGIVEESLHSLTLRRLVRI